MASSTLTLFCLFLLLSLTASSSSSLSLNLRRQIPSRSNGLDLISFSYITLPSLDLDRPSLPAAEDIHDLLPLYGFPKGLLPDNVKSYTLSDDGAFTVELISSCVVHFPHVTVVYKSKIGGKLSNGSVKDVKGIIASFFILAPITAMDSDPSSGKIVFSVGSSVSRTFPASMFENIQSCSRKLSLEAY